MGTWGISIFSDDVAADVRRDYNDLLSSYLVSDEEAEEMILKAYDEYIGDQDEPVFWLALAKAEYMQGRLSELVKQKALQVIDSDDNLKVWLETDKKTYNKRKAVLDELREQLLGEQPPRKKVKKATRHVSPFKVGDVVAYHMVNGFPKPWMDNDEKYVLEKWHGKYILFQVIDIDRHYSSRLLKEETMEDWGISIMIYNWIDDDIPSLDIIDNLKYVNYSAYYLPYRRKKYTFTFGKTPEERYEQVEEYCDNRNLFPYGTAINTGMSVTDVLKNKQLFHLITNRELDLSYINQEKKVIRKQLFEENLEVIEFRVGFIFEMINEGMDSIPD